MGRMCPIKSGPTYFDDVGVKNISRLRCSVFESFSDISSVNHELSLPDDVRVVARSALCQ